MNVAIFVNSQRDIEKLNILLKSASIDYDLIITDSFNHLIQTFENKKISILLCQLENPNCSAVEVFQLARMYNPDTVNIAMGTDSCIEELIDTFNTENLFKVIRMPLQHKNDILEPISSAFNENHSSLQHEYETKSFEEENNELTKEIAKYSNTNTTNNLALQSSKLLFNVLHKQNYAFYKSPDKIEIIDFSNFLYGQYIESYYFSEKNMTSLLTEIIKDYQNPQENKIISIRHTLEKSPEDDIKARIIFIIKVLSEFISRQDNGYKITVQITKKDNHYLLRFQNEISKNLNELKSYFDSDCYKLMKSHLNKACLKWNLSFNNNGLDMKAIIN